MFEVVVLSTENDGETNERPPDPLDPDKSITKESQGPMVDEATTLTLGWIGATGESIVKELLETFDQALQGRPPFCNTRHFARITPPFTLIVWPTSISLPETWNNVTVMSSTHRHRRSTDDVGLDVVVVDDDGERENTTEH
jgi:hypothetical protein